MANTNIMLLIKHNIEKAKGAVKEFNEEAKEMYPELSKANKEAKSFKDSLKEWGSVAKNTGLIGWIGTIKEGLDMLTKLSSKQAQYIEDLNFLDQAYNNSAESGLKLLDTLEKTVGYDPAGLTRQLATFRQLGNALEIDDKIANRLAENLIKLSVDTKSITGASLDTVTNKYMSAMAGNTRAVRAYGIDVTQAGLQQQALALGIEKSVSEMNRAEKSILTYIAMARQMSSANGDMARTVNSVANQYEIFKNQISETGRLLGGFLIPILKAVLPLVNGVLMAINVLINSLLSLFGIDASSLSEEFGTIAVDLDDVSGGFDDIGDSATKAGKAAKEAQKSLRGFDKLNVIKTPTSAGGSGGGSVSGGVGGLGAIDASLLSKLTEYDLHLDQISNKAAEIRDSIMEWLGFTKLIDPITGDISWEYQGLRKTLSNMWDSFKKLNPLIKAFVGFGIATAFKDLAFFAGKLTGIIGKNGIIKNFNKINNIFGKIKGVLFGATGIVVGFNLVSDGMQKIIRESDPTVGALEAVGGGLASIAGGAMAGYSIAGGWGAVVGGIAGFATSLASALESIGKRRDVLGEIVDANKKKLDEFTDSLRAEYEQVEKNASQDMTKIIVSENLINELERITDSNGKVQKGYEDRAKFIINELKKAYGIEIEMIDGVVKNRDKQIDKVKELIKQEKAQIYKRLAEEKYEIALKNQVEAENKLIEAKARRKVVYDDLVEAQKELSEAEDPMTMAKLKYRIEYLTKKYDEMNEQVEQATDNVAKNEQAIANYTGITTAVINGDAKAIEEYEKRIQNSFSEAGTNLSAYFRNRLELAYDYGEMSLKIFGKTYDKLTEQEKQFLDQRKKDVIQELIDETGSVDDMSDEYADAWRRLANLSKDDFLTALGDLKDDETRQKLLNKLYPAGIKMSEEVQKGINAKFPQIKITPKVISPSAKELANVASSIGTGLASALSLNLGLKANGGLFSSGVWRPMKAYANGGFPSQGEIFMAREKGPELVGKIGNSTAVMNNNQILDQMTIAVARGMSANKQDTNVNIIAEGDTEGMLQFIKFKEISKNRQFGL